MKKLPAGLLALSLLAFGCDSDKTAAARLISISATGAEAGKPGLLRLSFDNPTPNEVEVKLASSEPSVGTVKDKITVARGTLAAEVPWNGVAIGSVTFSATAGSAMETTRTAVVDHFQISSIDFDSNTLEMGAQTTLSVFLNATAPQPLTVELAAADPSIVTVPSTVAISPWSSFGRSTLAAAAVGSTTVTGKLGGSASGSLVVVDHARLVRTFSSTQAVEAGGTLALHLAVDAVVAATTPIAATSSDPSVVAAPASVAIPAGAAETTLTLPVVGVGQTNLTFTLADSMVIVPVTSVSAVHLVSLRAPSSTQVGATDFASLTVDAVAASAHAVTLTSSDPTLLSVPAQATVLAGSNSANFPLRSLKSGTVTVTASFGGVSVPALIYVGTTPPTRLQTSWSTARRLVVGATGDLYINLGDSVAGTVSLASSDATVIAVPPAVVVPGYTQAVRLVALKPGKVTITITAGTATEKLDLEVVAAPGLVLDPSYFVQPGMTTSAALRLDALAPTGTQITFASSSSAVVAAPAAVTLTEPATNVAFGLSGLQTGTAILTVTVAGSSSSAVVYVGTTTHVPVYLNGAGMGGGALEIGAASFVYASFTEIAASEVPITVTLPPSPSPALLAIAEANPILQVGENTAYIPVVAKNVGAGTLNVSAGGVTLPVSFSVVATPSFYMSLAPTLGVAKAMNGGIFADCVLATDHSFALSSSNPAFATVSPATVTLSPMASNGGAQFVVKGVSSGSVTITATAMPGPSPSPFSQPLTVSP